MEVLFIEVKVKPEKLDEYLALIKEDAVHSERDEPGCLRFDVLQDTEDPHKFFYYEVYRDAEARAAHCETPHFKHYADHVNDLLAGPIIRHVLRNFHPTDGEWR